MPCTAWQRRETSQFDFLYRGREHTTTKVRSSFWTWIESLRIQLQKNVPCIWHIERVQIDAIKFERAQIRFFSDVLILLPSSSSLLKVPITSFLVTWILFFKEYLWSPDSCLHCMFAIPGTEKLIDLKQEDHRSATRLRAISPFTPASDERENQEG